MDPLLVVSDVGQSIFIVRTRPTVKGVHKTQSEEQCAELLGIPVTFVLLQAYTIGGSTNRVFNSVS